MKQLSKLKKSFWEIAPLWDKFFKTGVREDGLDMSNSRCCVVGEAYGFNLPYPFRKFDDPYDCEECCHISYRFMYASDNFTVEPAHGWHGQSLEEVITEFEDHWNECHVK